MDYDLFVIGGGSGGVAAARRAASYGARVGLAESRHLGGTCVNRGCVPKKLMVYAGQVAYELAGAAGFGWKLGQAGFSWPDFRRAMQQELTRLQGVYAVLLQESGVTVHAERARLAGAHAVELGGRRLSSRVILIAVGGKPWRADYPGSELASVSDDVFELERFPERILIQGSGYIGVEMAGIFRALGSEVTLCFRSEAVLPRFDQDVREHLTEEMKKKGIRILAGTRPGQLSRRDQGFLYQPVGADPVECDRVLSALGRVPNTRDLGLEEAGVELDVTGAVRVDEDLKTSLPGVYAVGDCKVRPGAASRLELTPVAIAEGRALAETLFHDNPTRVDYRDVPTAVFSLPAVGTVGLTEAEARERYAAVEVYRTSFRPMKHTLSGSTERVLLKLVVDPDSGRVVGCHMVANEAPELAQALAVAVKAGATKADFDRTVALHPTLAEELVLLREPVS